MSRGLSDSSVGAKEFFDIPYRIGGDAHPHQRLDLFVPEGRGPFPLGIWIHGGGWAAGDKNIDFAPLFLREGLALAAINYRLASEEFPFPAQIEDCFSALAWLREHSMSWRVDANRIGLLGHSAGAHLAALMASACATDQFSASGCPDVQAVVGFSGPFDLGRERGRWPTNSFVWNPEDPFCTTFFPGGVYDETFARLASPASLVRAGLPPMLLIHGEKDDIVPPQQAEVYANSASALGTDVTFRLVPDANHDLGQVADWQETVHFLKRILSGAVPATNPVSASVSQTP